MPGGWPAIAHRRALTGLPALQRAGIEAGHGTGWSQPSAMASCFQPSGSAGSSPCSRHQALRAASSIAAEAMTASVAPLVSSADRRHRAARPRRWPRRPLATAPALPSLRPPHARQPRPPYSRAAVVAPLCCPCMLVRIEPLLAIRAPKGCLLILSGRQLI
jgi:hypothetical protein